MKINNVLMGLMLLTSIASAQTPCKVRVQGKTPVVCNGLSQLHVDGVVEDGSAGGGPQSYIWSLSFVNNDTGFVGAEGVLAKTEDGGKNWITKLSENGFAFRSVYFTNQTTGYATGYLHDGSGYISKLYKTTDGGSNWVEQKKFTGTALYCVQFKTDSIGYMSGLKGTIYKTVDAGNTWIKKTCNTAENLSTIYFFDTTTGYTVGSEGSVFRTTDGGENWSTAGKPSPYPLSGIYFTSATTGCVVGAEGLFRTTNGGQNWTHISSELMLSVFFIDGNTGYAGGRNTLYKTVDEGVTWRAQPLNNSLRVEAIFFPSPKVGYIGGMYEVPPGPKKILKLREPDAITWSPATGLNSSTIADPVAIVTKKITYKATTLTDGCVAEDSVTIDIDPLTVNAGNDKIFVCGEMIQLDSAFSNYTNEAGLITYSWSPVDGLSATNIANPVCSVKKTTTYTVTVTTPNGCQVSDSIKVIITPLSIDAGTDTSHICGSSIQLQTSINYNGTIGVAYLWLPSTGLSNHLSPEPYTNAGPITYTVTATVAGCVASDEINVTLAPLNAPQICMVGMDSTNRNIIMWNTKAGSSITKQFNIYRETSVAGNFVKIGTAQGMAKLYRDMSSDPKVKSNKYKISIVDSCDVETNQSAHHKTMHLAITKGIGTSWNLIWEHYEGFSVPTYTIYRGSAIGNLQFLDAVSGGSNQYTDYNPPPGELYYQVEVVNTQACEAYISTGALRSNVASNNSMDIGQNNEPEVNFILYPNPAKDVLMLHLEQPLKKEMAVYIYNSVGMLVKHVAIQQHTQQIDVDDLSNGIYLIELKSAAGVSRKKVTIQR